MDCGYSSLTVCFQEPFWVGLYQRDGGDGCELCRIVFGGEPGDGEVYAWLLELWRGLVFGPVEGEWVKKEPANPKRRQREIHRAVRPAGVGTRAQEALKRQQAQGKEARKRLGRAEREAERERRFVLRQEKRRKKHSGH